MKNILKYQIILIMVLGFGSCVSLDTPPTSEITENVYWQSKADFDMALTGCYAGLQSNVMASSQPFFDCMTDNSSVSSQSAYGLNIGYFLEGAISPSNGGIVSDLYANCYKAIIRTNIFLKNIDSYKGSDIAASRTQLIGEASFIRGYCYWMLYLYYGEVPIVKEVLDLTNQIKPKSTLNEVYLSTMADIELAIKSLPDKTYKAMAGHATKSAALALKSRILMYQATLNRSTPDVSLFQQAYDAISQITVYNNTALDVDYAKIFQPATQEASNEIMFSIKYKAPSNYSNWDIGASLYNNVKPTKDLWDSYEAGDKRRDATIALNGKYIWPGGQQITLPTTYAFLVKAARPVLTPASIWTGSEQSDQDAVIIRYGEVLLLKAEVANELGKPVSEIVNYINTVRTRSGLGALLMSLSQAQLRTAIRNERRVECCFEFMRWYDLKRWGILNSRLNGFNPDPIVNPGRSIIYPERQFYLPLPQYEIDISNGILIQNPAYN